MPQTAGNPAHQLLGKAEDFVRDLACVHQVAGQDEQRNGDQKIGVDAGDHFLADDHHGVVQNQAAQHGAGADGNTDRDADQQKNHKSDEKDCHCTLPPLVCVGSVWDYNPIHKLVGGLNDDKTARDGHGQEMPGFGHKLHG